MSTNISVFGLVGRIIATNTFPTGFDVTAFADDADPLDSPDLQVAETAMGPNGDMVIWSRPQGIEIASNVLPTTEDDVNLAILLEANRVAKGKTSARDSVTMVWTYPNGLIVTATKGAILSGPAVPAAASSGRLKSHRYLFRFEQVSRTGGVVLAQ